jgi:valyl-tRNA synthetase
VKIAPLAEPAIKAVEDGRTRFVPENYSKIYFEWMRNIKDWCVSRQLWWGHRIPAWYDEQGGVFVGRDEAEVRAKFKIPAGTKLTQDTDVLDTWFSSALWPYSTLGWPEKTPELHKFYPTSVLVTGFDIIFFWVARMMMFGLRFMGDVPFRDVYITGLIRDEFGDKMSKSKGNVIDPLDIVDGIDIEALVAKRTSGLMQPQMAATIEKNTRKQYPTGMAPHGTDALRFTFAALASPSRDIRFDMARVAGYRNFCNKLWNAARFVSMTVGETAPAAGPTELSVADRWIRSRFGKMLAQFESAIAEYRFDFAATALYEFTWYEFCDWYLELTKPVMQSETSSEAAKLGTRQTLAEMLEALQRALHPLMPFITEEIWQLAAPLAGRKGETVMLQPFPKSTEFEPEPEAEREIEWIRSFILGLRQIRSGMDIAPSKKLPVLLQNASADDLARVSKHRAYLERLGGLESITPLAAGASAPQSATALVGELTILVPMAGLIDADAEIDRLSKKIEKTRIDRDKIAKKLSNENFVKNAPPDVVQQDRDRIADFDRTIASLEVQLARVRSLKGGQ